MPHVTEFLAGTADRPRAVVTLLPEAVARDVLAAHEIDIHVIVGRHPHIRPKPSGDGLREALSRLGATGAPATMVGDSTWDAVAAADAAIGFVGVHAVPGEFASIVPPVPVCGSLVEVLALLDPPRSDSPD